MKKWMSPLLPILSYGAYLFLKLYFLTLRTSLSITKETKKALEDTSKGAVLMVWHDSLFALPLLANLCKNRPVTILISKSRDGDIPTRIAHFFKGVATIRVQGGARHIAVQESLEALQQNRLLLITPDGPRGPKRVMKPGSCFLAQKADVSLFSFRWTASRTAHLSTWDAFRIPLPFSSIHAHLDGPFTTQSEAQQALH